MGDEALSAPVIPYTPGTVQMMALDFSRGQVGVGTIQFIEGLVRAIRDLETRVTALEAQPAPHVTTTAPSTGGSHGRV